MCGNLYLSRLHLHKKSPVTTKDIKMVCSYDDHVYYWLQNRCWNGYVALDNERIVAHRGISRSHPKAMLKKDSCWLKTGESWKVMARFRFKDNGSTICFDKCGNLVSFSQEELGETGGLDCFFSEEPVGNGILLRSDVSVFSSSSEAKILSIYLQVGFDAKLAGWV